MYLEKNHNEILSATWNTPEETAYVLRVQAMWDWLYDD